MKKPDGLMIQEFWGKNGFLRIFGETLQTSIMLRFIFH